MPERFDSGAYDPETTKLMKHALAAAWAKFRTRDDSELTRLLLASSIIDQIDSGLETGRR